MTWGKAVLRSLPWAGGALLVAVPTYFLTLEVPGPGSVLSLLLLAGIPVVVAVVAGFVHRDGKVTILTGLFALLLAGVFLVAFIAIALTGLPGP